MAPLSRLPFRTIAFDLDGTLADTAPDIAAGLNRMLAALGRDTLAQDAIRDMVGGGARSLVQRALTITGGAAEELVDQGLPMYLDFYAQDVCVGTRPYPGVEAALDALAADGIALALCTNKVEQLTHALVEALGWQGRFASVVGGDTLPTRKPEPAMLHEAIARAGGAPAVFVGDSITDADTARAAAVPFVAVSFGYSDRPVEALGADAVIDAFCGLHAALVYLAERNAFTSR
ncbi:MAG TPA: phosphoglycolate phosphatase [Allosphingosinicella sp.]|jgi:phosphoglycolate phosphatase